VSKWKKEKRAAQVVPKFPSFIERYVFSRSKSRIRFPPCFHPLHIYIFHTHAYLDLIVWLISLDPLFDFTIYALQVCMHYLPTYKLHISLLVIGWEREGIMLFCLSPKILHILREERRQSTIVALVRIHKYHIWETWEGHTKESLSFILKILQWLIYFVWLNGFIPWLLEFFCYSGLWICFFFW
jgi:hypothetical protein